jgi:hypothetical protein
MARTDAKDIARLIECKGPEVAEQCLREALEEKHLRPEDFSLRDLFEELVPDGREMVRLFSPGKSGGIRTLEAADAVAASQFGHIYGQVFYSTVMEAASSEEFVFTPIIPTIPTEFSGERIPGMAEMGDQAGVVNEGEQYPYAGFTEDWIDTPPTVKRGNILALTKEMFFFDRTGLALMRARRIGDWLGVNKEKRIIDGIVDENTTAARWKYRDNVIATYGDSSGTHDWDNLAATNALQDWTDIDNAEQLAAALTDPNTGEPLVLGFDTIIVTPQLRATAYYILAATQQAMQVGGFATSGNLVRMDSPSPIGRHEFSASYRVLSSRLLAARMATDTSWFVGRPSAAFAYMQNWPITPSQAPPNSEDEFNRDIVTKFKASERGTMATINPRYMVKSTA